jgi:beta-lactam-binding protein with PASTA domain
VDLALGRIGGDGAVITAQSPSPGDAAAVGSSVDVRLEPSPPVLATVPDLVGLAASEVPTLLRNRGLVLGTRSGDGDTVRRQSPPPGSRVPQGTAVDISVEGN